MNAFHPPVAAAHAGGPAESSAFASLRASYRTRDKGDRQFVAALARGLAILRAFRAGDRYLPNQEIARRTGLPKPTVSRLTHTLTTTGFLAYAQHRDEYSLGVGVLALGHAYLAALNIRELAGPMMQEMADYAKATVTLGELDHPHMVILEICHGNPTHRLRVDIGSRLPRHTTALGRAHLAGLAPAQREEAIETIAKRLPAGARADIRASIQHSLRAYDKHGLVLSCGDWRPDVYACGAPLVSRDGTRVFALSCSGPSFELGRKRLTHEIGPQLLALRDRIFDATQGFL
jgi:DNA-binding IclR family transcriptional regulator